MKTYVINLGRRKDRLALMSAQLNGMSLSFERVPAIDSVAVENAWLAQYFAARGPLGTIPKGDQCCSLSHRCAWATFLASYEPYAMFLEDDVLLDPGATDLLRDSGWLPPNVDLLKLEHFGPESQRVLLGEPVQVATGRYIAPIHSRHTGAAAYILSRNAAKLLMSLDAKWPVPVDHMLFNANVSGIAALLRPHQLMPTIARQHDGFGASDIAPSRRPLKTLSFSYAKRELVRAYYETRLLPLQIAKVLIGRAQLIAVRGRPLRNRSPDC